MTIIELCGILLGLQILDIWTTKIFLGYGINEANPLIKFLLDKMGENGLVVGKTVLSIIMLYGILLAQISLVTYILIAAYVFLISWNILQIRKVRK